VPWEQSEDFLHAGETVLATDSLGAPLGRFEVVEVRNPRVADHTQMVKLRVPAELAPSVAGFRMQHSDDLLPIESPGDRPVADEVIICRCEHVSAGEIRAAIRGGVRDINELKAQLRVCMGACCGKNCPEHLMRLFREQGVEPGDITLNTQRPLFVEVPFGVFARGGGGA
jgi:bacterioferritin-associated ferredoxin